MPKPSPPSAPQHPRWDWRYVRLGLLAVILALGGAVLWHSHQRPKRLYEEALTLSPFDPIEADRHLEEAIASAGGDYPEAQLLRCQLLARQGLWDEALGGFSEIRDPSKLPPHDLAELAEMARSSGVFVLAEFALKAAKTPGPDLPNVLRQSIRLHLETDHSDQALKECRELLELVPDDAVAWQVQGAIHLDRKRLPEAEAAFREALVRTPAVDQQSSMREQLIRVLLDAGRAEEARKELDLLRSAGTLTPETQLMDAYADRLLGRWEAAHATVDWLLSNAPASEMQARLLRGMLWIDQGQPAQAVPDLEQVISQQPYNKEAQNKLAQAYRKLNQPERALPHAEAAQRLTEYAEELLRVEDKLNLEPKNEAARQRVAELYDLLGQPEKAQKVRRRRSVVP